MSHPGKPEACPLCGVQEIQCQNCPGMRDASLIECPICGVYEISRQAMVNLKNEDRPERNYLPCYTRQHWEQWGRPAQIRSNWPELVEPHANSSIETKLDKLMRLVEKRTKELGGTVEISGFDWSLYDVFSKESSNFLVDHAASRGLLKTSWLLDSVKCQITFDGWKYIERGGLGTASPKRVFVAMSFNPDLEPAFKTGIEQAVATDCNLICIRLDKQHHNEKICDRILSEIRRSHIVVADFTEHKAGVYFEAGFALALGKEVIWTVRENNKENTHFDTRQYNHIIWKEPADLREQLRDRIQAMFPNDSRNG
jgi:nucleoside 2-deoxyribosyltransferase